MPDVFLSYKKEDFPFAERVVNGLKAQGLSVWWDESLTTRSAWDAELEQEIGAAATVVVLWTPRSVDSEWVRIEAHYALEHGKLIPVMMEPCSIPLAFTLRQTVNLSDWQAASEHRHWRKLLAWIADLAAAKSCNTAPKGAGSAPANAFRTAVDHLASGEPVVDGTFVNASSPAGTAFRDGSSLPIVRIVPAGTVPDRIVPNRSRPLGRRRPTEAHRDSAAVRDRALPCARGGVRSRSSGASASRVPGGTPARSGAYIQGKTSAVKSRHRHAQSEDAHDQRLVSGCERVSYESLRHYRRELSTALRDRMGIRLPGGITRPLLVR